MFVISEEDAQKFAESLSGLTAWLSEPAECAHEWKSTYGIWSEWKDCKKCNLKFEDLNKGE